MPALSDTAWPRCRRRSASRHRRESISNTPTSRRRRPLSGQAPVGDVVEVSADVFRDGHEKLRAVAAYRPAGARKWAEAELHPLDAHHNGVRWAGSFVVDELGRWEFYIHAWTDLFATWRDELQRKLEAGQHQLASELSEGAVLLADVAPRAKAATAS